MQLSFSSFIVTKWEKYSGKAIIVRVGMKTDIGFRIIQSDNNKSHFKIAFDCTTTASDVINDIIMLTYGSMSEYFMMYEGASYSYIQLDSAIKEMYARHIRHLKNGEEAVPLWDVTEVIDPTSLRKSVLQVLKTAV